MKSLSKVKKLFLDPNYRFVVLAEHGVYRKLEDEAYVRCMYKAKFGKYPDLVNPKTYTEKLQWLKLYDRKADYTRMVDKHDAKEYVAERIGDEFIIPTLGVWNTYEEIDFALLPNQFVLKTTHDSGGVVICKDKHAFDHKKAKKILTRSLQRNFYALHREWPYKSVQPRIIAEEYIEDAKTEELRDYKFFCFDGKVKALFVASDRQNKHEETKFDFFDENYQHLPVENGHPNARVAPEKPVLFEEMKNIAERLSSGFPHLRVDLYEVNGKIYFGELTFYHWSGFVPFSPAEWDETFGSWLSLPSVGEHKDKERGV